MEYMLRKIIHHYGTRRYILLAVITGFFLSLGAFAGSFEECVPLVPIVVSLAIGLGWDKETGLGMSLIAVGCGFASGVLNPFTVGVAQKIAGVPMFSGMSLRFFSGILIYILLILFLRNHAKKIEQPVNADYSDSFKKDSRLEKALLSFGVILGSGILTILASTVISALQDYTMIIVVLMFLIAGIVSASFARMGTRRFFIVFKDGVISILPAILMILMASSIKYILVEGKILDTLLYYSVNFAQQLPKGLVVLFLYLIALILNFFVSSGSAEAILLMPLMVPLAQICGISSNLCVLAYAYGDGFSNVFYPTNAVLLISLGLVDMSYGKYVRWSWKFQAMNLILTSGVLLLGLGIGY